MGPELSISELLYRPGNSLILQSYKATERTEPLNGDGFGVGWYAPDITPTPCVFTSLTPAWSNHNLRNLAEHVKSSCFFAHVRAASPGMRVSEANCHPFRHGTYLWMHNGTVAGFHRIKRRMRQSLPDDLYLGIEGTTDSEHAFAVFLNLLPAVDRRISATEMGQTLAGTVVQLEQWMAEAGISEPSFSNFAVTDGHSMAALRFVSDAQMEPVSLYYSTGRKDACADAATQARDGHSKDHSVIIASERLTERKSDWVRVAPNHVLTVTADLDVAVELMQAERWTRAP